MGLRGLRAPVWAAVLVRSPRPLPTAPVLYKRAPLHLGASRTVSLITHRQLHYVYYALQTH